MFSLIITIVSIALVVALVAATMYHGGDTLTQGRTSAQASEWVAGAQQVAGAFRMAQALKDADPTTAKDLVTAGTLSSVPALFQEAEWTSSIITKNHHESPFDFVRSPTESLTLEVCQALDKMAGRTPVVDRNDLPASYEPEKFHAYGCSNGEGLAFYFKI